MNKSCANGAKLEECAAANNTELVYVRDHHVVITTYWVLMIIGALGNLAVLVTLARTRHRRSRVDLIMTHLAVADVMVTCGVIPIEIGWMYTNEWLAGNIMCKIVLVIRAFGLYLSSNVLVCISLDRFFAVLYPQKLHVARRRSKRMLYWAWAMALASSLPQSAVFRVLEHPRVPGFEQCVSFGAFSSHAQEIAYNVSCVCAMYFIPLLIITVCYICIFCKIRRCSKGLDESCAGRGEPGGVRLRRSDHRLLERARRRTLRMTLIIVSVFALCWLPYAVMALWYMIDRESASQVPPQLQDLLFAMAVSNSCMNPFVYGSYALRNNKTFQKLMKICCWSSSSTNNTDNAGLIPLRNNIGGVDDAANKLNKVNNQRTRMGVRFAETSLVEGRGALPPRPYQAPKWQPPQRLQCAPHERQRALLECQKARTAVVPTD